MLGGDYQECEKGDEVIMLSVDEIIQVLNDVLRKKVSSTDKVDEIQDFVNSLEGDKVGGDSEPE